MFLEDSDFDDEPDAKATSADADNKKIGAKTVSDMKVESFEPDFADEVEVENDDSR